MIGNYYLLAKRKNIPHKSHFFYYFLEKHKFKEFTDFAHKIFLIKNYLYQHLNSNNFFKETNRINVDSRKKKKKL